MLPSTMPQELLCGPKQALSAVTPRLLAHVRFPKFASNSLSSDNNPSLMADLTELHHFDVIKNWPLLNFVLALPPIEGTSSQKSLPNSNPRIQQQAACVIVVNCLGLT